MADLHVSLDPATLRPAERKLRHPLEEQLSSALQAAAERVRQAYAGEPVEVVADRVLAEARAALHPDVARGFHPDPGQVRRLAMAIVHAAAREQARHRG